MKSNFWFGVCGRVKISVGAINIIFVVYLDLINFFPFAINIISSISVLKRTCFYFYSELAPGSRLL